LDKDFFDQVVIVTGASRGIGQATALAFARQGALVVANYGKDEAGAQETFEQIDRAGGRCWPVRADLSQAGEVERMVDWVEGEVGPIQVLVNNAAVHSQGDFLTAPLDEFERVWGANVRGLFYLSQLVARRMAERRRGSIVHISSILAQVVIGGVTAYAASKGAVESLGRAMAIDLAPYNVRVNVVRPGLIRTKMLLDTMPERSLQEDVQRYIPGGRFGDPEEIAQTILFLASGRASYINGAVIPVDGALGVRESGLLLNKI